MKRVGNIIGKPCFRCGIRGAHHPTIICLECYREIQERAQERQAIEGEVALFEVVDCG